MVQNFEDCRRKWLRTQEELGSCKEVLTKAETERGALEVKLKHARNQVDVEIRRRQKAEADCEKLVCGVTTPSLLFVYFEKGFESFSLCCAGPTGAADPGAADLRGLLQQHPAECGAAHGSGLPQHQLSDTCQHEHQQKVRQWSKSLE